MCVCVCVCVWLVGQRSWPAVYGDYESRWTAMPTGEGSLTLGVSAPPLLLLSFTCLQSSQQQDLVCVRACVRASACVCRYCR